MYNSDDDMPDEIEYDGYTFSRDYKGRYVNSKGVAIEVDVDRFGKVHISAYDGDPRKYEHSSLHFNLKYKEKDGKETAEYKTRYHNDDRSEKEETSGNCYLTTSCMKYLKDNFDDNCYELSILRNFRDKYVSQEDIEHYYKVAPKIVEAIDNSEYKDKIYNDIYKYIIEPCIQFIEKQEYQKAYDRYKISSMVLEKNFLAKVKVKQMINKRKMV